jgi:hypothetical protein
VLISPHWTLTVLHNGFRNSEFNINKIIHHLFVMEKNSEWQLLDVTNFSSISVHCNDISLYLNTCHAVMLHILDIYEIHSTTLGTCSLNKNNENSYVNTDSWRLRFQAMACKNHMT